MEPDEQNGGEPKGAKPDSTPKPGDGAKPPQDEALAKRLADTEARLAEVTKESIERRQENKELRSFRDSLASLFGGKADPEKVKQEIEQARTAATVKVARGIRHSAAVSAMARAGAHDPEQAARLVDLGGIEVDEETFAVKDPTALTAKVEAFKAASPWAFKSAAAPDPTPTPKPGSPTPTPPTPKLTEGKTPYEAWRAAMDRKDVAEASRLWNEHPEIRKQVRLVQ